MDTNNKNYKYILIDQSDPVLMWNCAISIIVFMLLLFFVYMDWKPLCPNDTFTSSRSISVDSSTIKDLTLS
jgi:hypothetical protein